MSKKCVCHNYHNKLKQMHYYLGQIILMLLNAANTISGSTYLVLYG